MYRLDLMIIGAENQKVIRFSEPEFKTFHAKQDYFCAQKKMPLPPQRTVLFAGFQNEPLNNEVMQIYFPGFPWPQPRFHTPRGATNLFQNRWI